MLAPRPARTARPTIRSRGRSQAPALVRAVLVLALMVLLATKPELRQGITDRVGEVFVGVVVPADQSPTNTRDPAREKKTNMQKNAERRKPGQG